ncbi:porphobilinogen synthase [Candidatus Berkiella cookevillensis]|uniref:Delta-aminolevulinic acid dehydratase n=1 Tax=Candidatus Berkiella cookevillensis TaxID=437022 RepID=A0A0Q9YN61_9GAMM|nr:porphobilinogen synthase [Candidatus Berkiella cookevillensis]MCS5709760.1 porphobilinogen synthase [Candidatus Berkiella cookevillensis]
MSADFASSQGNFPNVRLRRLRQSPIIRNLVRETELNINDFVLPLFVKQGVNRRDPISSMPGHFQLSPDNLSAEIRELESLGISSVILFGIPGGKDAHASDSYSDNGIIQQATRIIKDVSPNMLVISDICCCEYTDHGHCGVIEERDGKKDVCNDRTLEILALQAESHAKAGVDILAPSGMMDGQVVVLRQALDLSNYQHIPILSYAVKYSSGLYGPFRQAAEGTPLFGDRKSYQMDPANANEALREAAQDIAEGADMIMVKPAHTYLDVIHRIKQKFPEIPMAAYHVSGEFAMIKAAAERGWINERQVALEVLTSIKRAGADIIINYFAKDLAKFL